MTRPDLPARRLMLVHAHPDDESIGTGATMARYVSEGAAVTLVTCTLGEEGEVLVPELSNLAAHRDDLLAEHRLGELKQAMDVLGVTDFVRLGGDHRFRDSGMVWDESGAAAARPELREGVFWSTDLVEAADELVPLIRDRRPQVLVTYDQFGGYGHPDHIQAHRVASYAYLLAGVRSYRPDLGEPWTVDRVLWTAISAERMRRMVRAMRDAGVTDGWARLDPEGDLPPMVTPEALLDAAIDGTRWGQRKIDAMLAHATQITPDGDFFRGRDVLGDEVWSHEFFRLAAGRPFPASDGLADGLADDLFAGLV